VSTLTAVREGEQVLGHTVPRVYTPPLVTGPPGPCGCGCALTPDTSDGFEAVEFASDVLGVPPDPWQRWLLIHAMEKLPDGRPRFRRVLVLVARQNGKTYLLAILACYWMYLCGALNILGSSTKTATAVKAWRKAIKFAQAVPELAAEIPARGGVLTASGKEQWNVTGGARYEPVASNDDGGRGDSLDRVICDELRQHDDYSAYGASYHAMRARPFAQFWGISSMGGEKSVVLNDLSGSAEKFIETGKGDPRLGLFGWLPPADADPLDPQALAMANPSLNRLRPDGSGFMLDELLAEAQVAVGLGGEALTDFKTEALNVRVKTLNPAIDFAAWLDGRGKVNGFADLRGRVALCFDVAPSMQHATLYAAAVQPDGKVRVAPVKAWDGTGCADRAGRELPALVAKVRPRAFGWLPSGPGAAVGSALGGDGRRGEWPPRGVTVEEIRGDLAQVAMGWAELVVARQVVHGGDPLLDEQTKAAEKLARGDAWVFSRKGDGDCDAIYGAAGAAHLARQLRPAGTARMTVVSDD
jgi:hypothetical protein